MNGSPMRLVLVDALRGLAIALMVAFHFCFDLAYLGLADFDFYADPYWLHARTFILSMFLALVGVSLVLATGGGIRWRSYFRRLLLIAASAALVSVATWWLFGERFVFFGVLHFIALASVLGLLFVRAGWLNLVLAVVLVGFGNAYQSEWFNQTGWRWVGLMTYKPPTEDYVPLLPWFGVVLAGMFAAPFVRAAGRRSDWLADYTLARWLASSGRHSLIIYLVHQPLLLGALTVYKSIAL